MNINLDCPQVLDLLKNDYLDNELDPSLKAGVDRHLELCPKCRLVKENLEALAGALRSAARETPPASLWPRIQAGLDPQPARARSPRTAFQSKVVEFFLMRPSFAAAAAAAVLVLISAAFYMQSRPAGGIAAPPDLTSLADGIETSEANASFGSNIEEFLL